MVQDKARNTHPHTQSTQSTCDDDLVNTQSKCTKNVMIIVVQDKARNTHPTHTINSVNMWWWLSKYTKWFCTKSWQQLRKISAGDLTKSILYCTARSIQCWWRDLNQYTKSEQIHKKKTNDKPTHTLYCSWSQNQLYTTPCYILHT